MAQPLQRICLSGRLLRRPFRGGYNFREDGEGVIRPARYPVDMAGEVVTREQGISVHLRALIFRCEPGGDLRGVHLGTRTGNVLFLRLELLLCSVEPLESP